MTLLKQRLIAAHRAGDWELAKRLSQEKEREKKKRWCEVCGVPIRKNARFCYQHWIVYRCYSRSIVVLGLLLLIGCTVKKPVFSPAVAVTKAKAAAVPRSSVVAYVPVRTNVTLVWDYVTSPQYSFNVYGGPEPRFDSFRFITNVKNTYCTLSTDQPRMFFSVKVLDNFNLMESDWATK